MRLEDYNALLFNMSTLPKELQKHCISYIPCKGITEEIIRNVKLSTLSPVTLILKKVRPWFGYKFKYPFGDTYVIAQESHIKVHATYWTPFGGCWYPIALNYIGDGEYRSLCIHESGEQICEREFGNKRSEYSNQHDVKRIKETLLNIEDTNNQNIVESHIQKSILFRYIFTVYIDLYNNFLEKKMTYNAEDEIYQTNDKFTESIYQDFFMSFDENDIGYLKILYMDWIIDHNILPFSLGREIYSNSIIGNWKFSKRFIPSLDSDHKNVTYCDWQTLLVFFKKIYLSLLEFKKEKYKEEVDIDIFNDEGQILPLSVEEKCSIILDPEEGYIYSLEEKVLIILQKIVRKYSCMTIQHHVRLFFIRKKEKQNLARQKISKFIFRQAFKPGTGFLYQRYEKRFNSSKNSF